MEKQHSKDLENRVIALAADLYCLSSFSFSSLFFSGLNH
jgi:hypothetical protein